MIIELLFKLTCVFVCARVGYNNNNNFVFISSRARATRTLPKIAAWRDVTVCLRNGKSGSSFEEERTKKKENEREKKRTKKMRNKKRKSRQHELDVMSEYDSGVF